MILKKKTDNENIHAAVYWFAPIAIPIAIDEKYKSNSWQNFWYQKIY